MTSHIPKTHEEEKPKEKPKKASSWLADFRGAIYEHYSKKESREEKAKAKRQKRQRKIQEKSEKHIKLGAMGELIDWIAAHFDYTTPIYQWKKLAYRSGDPNMKLDDLLKNMEDFTKDIIDLEAPTISPQESAKQFVYKLEEMGIANDPQIAPAKPISDQEKAKQVAENIKGGLGDGTRSQTTSPTPTVKPLRAQDKPLLSKINKVFYDGAAKEN